MKIRNLPLGGCARPLGVLSAIDICFNGELICIASLLIVFAAPLTGDERKNKGDEDAIFCCDARGVPCDCIVSSRAAGDDRAIAAAGLLAGCAEFLVERAGVADAELRFDRRDVGEDMIWP